jgi:hypothetical protein
MSVLRITGNLAEALRHLKLLNQPRLIWIDAICINQNDLLESNSEVSTMGSIYHKAREVIVWLGPTSDTNGLALGTLERIERPVEYDIFTIAVL